MNYLTHQLLNPEEIKLLNKALISQDLPWDDGKKTAGDHAAKVKNNLQLNRDSEISLKFTNKLLTLIPSLPLGGLLP